MYCRYCGKEIPSNSFFCPNCGKKQNGGSSQDESRMFQTIKKHKKIVFLYILWCLIHVGLLISSPSEEQFQKTNDLSKTEAFYPYNTSLSKVLQWEDFQCNPLKCVDAYDSSELFFYVILLPLFIWGIEKLLRKVRPNRVTTSTTKGKDGKKLDRSILFVTLGIAGVVLLGIIGHVTHNESKTLQAVPIDTDSIIDDLDSIADEYDEYYNDYVQKMPQAVPVDVDSIVDVDEEDYNELDIDDNELYRRLSTGDTSYSDYYGKNMICRKTECSGIKVTAPESSDVVVIVKRNNEQGSVVGHAYVRAGDTYKINLLDGTYQTFFYYGEEWNPNKDMGHGVKGGFVKDEVFSKDNPQDIYSAVLSYVLQLRRDGNFHAEGSSRSEIF